MSFRLAVKLKHFEGFAEYAAAHDQGRCLHPIPNKCACVLSSGLYHHPTMVAAGWDQENKRQVGWVVRAGAEEYGKRVLSPMGHTWEVVEYEY
jgi:hypothetical protein